MNDIDFAQLRELAENKYTSVFTAEYFRSGLKLRYNDAVYAAAAANALPAIMDECERLREALDEAYTLLNPLGVDGNVWALRHESWMQQYRALKGGQK